MAKVIQDDPNVKGVGAMGGLFGGQSNQAFVFANLKPREERALSVDQFIEGLRPKLMGIPGVFTFLQNPPPITVSGQFGTSIYQLTLQSSKLEDIYTWGPQLMAKMTQLPRLCGRQ